MENKELELAQKNNQQEPPKQAVAKAEQAGGSPPATERGAKTERSETKTLGSETKTDRSETKTDRSETELSIARLGVQKRIAERKAENQAKQVQELQTKMSEYEKQIEAYQVANSQANKPQARNWKFVSQEAIEKFKL